MLKINTIIAKSIITKSWLPWADFVINPYTWCQHACKYCYANFMKKFSGHLNEDWWSFVDVKINAFETIKKLDKYNWKNIVIGSVTDPYQGVEQEYQITRQILEKIQNIEAHIDIITKSDLILRDLDILKNMKDLQVAISFSSLDDIFKSLIEPWTKSIESKIQALKTLHENNIKTVAFISPIFPYITDVFKLIDTLSYFVDEFWFENLNLYLSVKKDLYNVIWKIDSKLIYKYDEIYSGNSDYWNDLEKIIIRYCEEKNLNYKMYFHHGKK